MIKVAVLLPRSTAFPLIGVDFLNGIKNCLRQRNLHGEIEIITANIGFGLNEGEIYQHTENFVLNENADVVVIYASSKMAGMLTPLFEATQKLLIMTEMGANYSVNSSSADHIIFHTLNDSLYAQLTGRLAAKEGVTKAVLATSFYDGGYLHCHAMINGYVKQGGNIGFNFVSHQLKEEFTLQPVEQYLASNTDANGLLCLFSGEMAVLFYKKYQQELPCYVSPMMLDESLGRLIPAGTTMQLAKGYTGWVSSLSNEYNKTFIESYHAVKATPNLISLQGWETGLLLAGLHSVIDEQNNIPAAITAMKKLLYESPRGWMKIDEQFGCTYGPAHEVTVTDGFVLTVKDTIHDTATMIEEMSKEAPEGLVSNWRNTYLCL